MTCSSTDISPGTVSIIRSDTSVTSAAVSTTASSSTPFGFTLTLNMESDLICCSMNYLIYLAMQSADLQNQALYALAADEMLHSQALYALAAVELLHSQAPVVAVYVVAALNTESTVDYTSPEHPQAYSAIDMVDLAALNGVVGHCDHMPMEHPQVYLGIYTVDLTDPNGVIGPVVGLLPALALHFLLLLFL
ncbi:hypothetical protein MAR_003863, partial [Mya arenaria]